MYVEGQGVLTPHDEEFDVLSQTLIGMWNGDNGFFGSYERYCALVVAFALEERNGRTDMDRKRQGL